MNIEYCGKQSIWAYLFRQVGKVIFPKKMIFLDFEKSLPKTFFQNLSLKKENNK